MTNYGEEQEVLYVMNLLDVVLLRLEVRLCHILEVVVEDCLGLSEAGTGQALVLWNTDHVIIIQDKASHCHVYTKFIFQFLYMHCALFDSLRVLGWLLL